jgi:hypothetical protein
MSYKQRENGDGKQQHLLNWVKQRVAEGRDNLLESKEIIAFCHSREVEEAHPVATAFAVEIACEVLKSRQQVRSRRSWRCLSCLGHLSRMPDDAGRPDEHSQPRPAGAGAEMERRVR